MTSLSTEHTLIAAIPILVVLAVLSAAIVVFPKTNMDNRSRASQTKNQVPAIIPSTIESGPTTSPTPIVSRQKSSKPYIFPQTSK